MPSQDTVLAVKPRPQCLILVPRADEFIPVFHSLRHAVEHTDVEVLTLDRPVEYGGLVSDAALHIPRTIENADAVIVDLTNSRPNIMYELGFAHALKKPVLPIVRRDAVDIPSDLQGYLYFAYDLERNEIQLMETVSRWIQKTLRHLLIKSGRR